MIFPPGLLFQPKDMPGLLEETEWVWADGDLSGNGLVVTTGETVGTRTSLTLNI